MPSKKRSLLAASGAGGDKLYVEDVFSTYLYAGNGSTQTITNGIDLAGEGGLVWSKGRNYGSSPYLGDTLRGTTSYLTTDSSDAPYTSTNAISSFNADGYSFGSQGQMNANGYKFVSWTFRKAEKFFDVVTYTGDNNTNRAVPHSLGSVPAVIIIKSTSSATASTANWSVYHSSVWDTSTYKSLRLNSTAAANGWNAFYGVSAPTSDNFYVRSNGANTTGETYVAYLFASDAGGFGDDGSESIIKCGSVATNWAEVEVNLGFEPQFVIAKVADRTDPFRIFDNMRGVVTGGTDALLRADQAYYEDQGGATDFIDFTSTGFIAKSELVYPSTLIYIAIRRPMKTPESGTEVFLPQTRTGTASTAVVDTTITSDFFIVNRRNSAGDSWGIAGTRLQGATKSLFLAGYYGEQTDATEFVDVGMDSITLGTSSTVNQSGGTFVDLFFKRAPGFMDVVAYKGSSTVYQKPHNLGVAPELMIVKYRTSTETAWQVYSATLGADYRLFLDSDDASQENTIWDNASDVGVAPTATHFNVKVNSSLVNSSAGNYMAYLFATLAGVSKVGNYTGTAASLDLDMGFAAGARFFLCKRTDAIGSWYMYDTARGIIAGNDPYLLVDTTAIEATATDYVDPLASGLTLTAAGSGTINISGGTYIYLAIA